MQRLLQYLLNKAQDSVWHKILGQLQKIKEEGSFVRNVSISSSWNVFGILAQFILSPIITRIYTPEQYGVFTVLNTIAITMGLISSFRYSEAIVITDTRQQRNNVIAVAFSSILFISLLSLFAILLLKEKILLFIGAPWLGYLIYTIPLLILLNGVVEMLVMTNVWRKKFFSNGFSGFLVNISSRGFTIFYGFLIQPNAIGIIIGDLVGKIAGVAGVLSSFSNLKKKILTFYDSISIHGMKSVARMYKHFPFYSLPTNLLTGLSGILPVYFFQAQFNSGMVGSYALASSLLEIVNRLIPYSIASVFLSKAVVLKKNSLMQLAEATFKLYSVIFLLSAGIFTGFALLSKTVFPWIFGESWQLAGMYTGILSIYYSFYFIATSLTEVYKVIGKQRSLLGINAVSLLLKILMILLAVYFNLDAKYALLFFCLVSSIGCTIQIMGIFIHFRFKILFVTITLLLLMLVLCAISYNVNVYSAK